MEKSYYIFLGVVSVISLAIGSGLTIFFYCEKCITEDISIEDLKEKKTIRTSQEEGCDFYVDVSGAVTNPGVVCVHDGAIVYDAVKKAGDFNPQAYAFKYVAQRINLSSILKEEEKIYIPFLDDIVCKAVEDPQIAMVSRVMNNLHSSSTEKVEKEVADVEQKVVVEQEEKGDDCININTASRDRLMELTGIGETRANDIIDARPYSKLIDIKEVKGIGDATYEKIKDKICI